MNKHVTLQNSRTFWAKVAVTKDPTDCWEWQGCVGGNGYGYVRWHGPVRLAHRVAAFLSGICDFPYRNKGTEKSVVMHVCDNNLCCNPNHLYFGDNGSNIRDQYNKGRRRQPSGGGSVRARLSDEQALRLYNTFHDHPINLTQTAAMFGVSISTTRAIVNKTRYKNIHDEGNNARL